MQRSSNPPVEARRLIVKGEPITPTVSFTFTCTERPEERRCNPVSENLDVARNHSYEARRTRRSSEQHGVVPSDKPGESLGSDATGRRYRTSRKPREDKPEAPLLVYWVGQHSMTTETRLMTVAGSGGVLTAARSEGLHRNR
jgi:hypothetical protein